LKENNQNHLPCRELSKVYLRCRMDRNLMAEESFDKLGFDGAAKVKGITTSKEEEGMGKGSLPPESVEGKKEEQGFTAGTTVRTRRKGWLYSSS